MNAPRGTVIWYATRPGKVAQDGDGRNSPFTHHLVKALKQPAIEARKIISQIAIEMYDKGFEQEPWQEGIWLKDFYFITENERVENKKPAPVIVETKKQQQNKVAQKPKVVPIKKPKIESFEQKKIAEVKPVAEKDNKNVIVAKIAPQKAKPKIVEPQSVEKPSTDKASQEKEQSKLKPMSLSAIKLFSKKKLTLIDTAEQTREILLNYKWSCNWKEQNHRGTATIIFEGTEQDEFEAKVKNSRCPNGWGIFNGKYSKGRLTGNAYQYPKPCQGSAHYRAKLYSSPEGVFYLNSTYAPTNYQAKGEQNCVSVLK